MSTSVACEILVYIGFNKFMKEENQQPVNPGNFGEAKKQLCQIKVKLLDDRLLGDGVLHLDSWVHLLRLSTDQPGFKSLNA